MSRSLEDLARGYPIADAVFLANTTTTTTVTSSAEIEFFDERYNTTTTGPATTEQYGAWNNNTISGVWNNADQANNYALKFHKKVIQYCTEWQLEVSTRVARAKKETKYLLSRLTHYLKKVERLRQKSSTSSSSLMLSSPTVVTATHNAADPKLERNLGKLRAVWNAHEVKSTQWSYILEQVTIRGWKELYPLLQNILHLERDRSQSEYDLLSTALPAIETQLNQLFDIACQKVTPVVVDYPSDQQPPQQQPHPNATTLLGAIATLSGYGSSDDDDGDWLHNQEVIEVMLAPKNHYNKDLEESSASPRGIADIEHF
jgi:hypothetical protein